MADVRETLMTWLNDAYGMERSATKMLEGHAEDAQDLPEVQSRIRQHIDETNEQAERIKTCIEQLGGTASESKGVMGSIMGSMQGVASNVAEDKVVKNALADYAAENFEVASYQALVTAAEAAGEEKIADVCQDIMDQEQAMADWLREHLPQVVTHTLQTAD